MSHPSSTDSVLARLDASFQAAGQRRFLLESAAGSLMVSLTGARAIGCEFKHSPGNLFYHDPQLETPGLVQQTLAASPAAGDRLWIAPEVNYIFKDLSKVLPGLPGGSLTPTQMEPGDYHVSSHAADHVSLLAHMRLEDRIAKAHVSLKASRSYQLVGPPAGLDAGLTHFGFSLTNQLEVTEYDKPGLMLGVWDLLQIPPAGWLVCPTVGLASRPRSYYDSYTDDRCRLVGGAVHFRIDGQGRYKMGLSPLQTTGRMGYYRKFGKSFSTLLVRTFAVHPGLVYCDQPITELGRPISGDALQSFNGAGFGEMEHHEPALVTGQYPLSRAGTCVTHALIGPDALIQAAGEKLLGVDLPDDF
jgi:hypothetical protein